MNVLQRVFSVLVIGGSFCSSVLATTTTEAPRTFRAEVCFFLKKNFLGKLFEICVSNNFLQIIFKIFVGSGSESGLYEGEVRLEGQTQVIWFGLVWFCYRFM